MKIKLKQFEGPLNLLLQLIEEQKLEITEISLAQVTEQFLEYIKQQTSLAPHELADWLVIAAKLLVIKSKALLPALTISQEDEQDATNLTWQLYQYKRYREATKILYKFDIRRKQGFGRHTSFVEKITFYPDESVTLPTLRDCLRYLAKTLEQITSLPKKVLEEVVSISEKIMHLQSLIQEKIELRLHDLILKASSKTEIIVIFLALLELVKQKILTVEQEAMFSDIVIKRRLTPEPK